MWCRFCETVWKWRQTKHFSQARPQLAQRLGFLIQWLHTLLKVAWWTRYCAHFHSTIGQTVKLMCVYYVYTIINVMQIFRNSIMTRFESKFFYLILMWNSISLKTKVYVRLCLRQTTVHISLPIEWTKVGQEKRQSMWQHTFLQEQNKK